MGEKEMKSKRISAVLVAGALFGVGAMLPANSIQAKTVKYKIFKHQKVKKLPTFTCFDKDGKEVTVNNGKMTFSYEEPHIKSKAKGSKKINKYLHKNYTDAAKYFQAESKDLAESIYDTNQDDWALKNSIFHADKQTAKVYVSGKYFSVVNYQHEEETGKVEWGDAVTYSLKTGKNLKLTDVLKGSPSKIMKRIYKAQTKSDRFYLKGEKLNNLSFIVKGKKVYPVYKGYISDVPFHFFKPLKIEK